MIKLSRRALASYVADQLINDQSVSKIAERMAAALVAAGRVKEIDFLINDIRWELEQRNELVMAEVTAARPMSKDLLADLKASIKQVTEAKRVELSQTIDQSVLGGVKVETANSVWDETIKGRLSDLREVF